MESPSTSARRAPRVLVLTLLAALSGATSCTDPVFPDPGELRFQAVAAGSEHSCGIDVDGAAWCWGSNSRGQLGIDREGGSAPVPVAVAGGHTFSSLDGGADHTCGVARDGGLWCWGSNGSGQLGVGDLDGTPIPVRVAAVPRVVSVRTGVGFTCAVALRGEGWCWGRNSRGQAGQGFTSDRADPAPLSGSWMWDAIDAGGDHACGVSTDGRVACWGDGGTGALGIGGVRDVAVPVAVYTPARFRRVATGFEHTCAVEIDGPVRCWGASRGSALGDASYQDQHSPAGVAGTFRLDRLAAGQGPWNCGASTSDRLVCWGRRDDAGFLDGYDPELFIPTVVDAAGTVADVALGRAHLCVLRENGTVACAGTGESGQLGNGLGRGSGTFVEVGGV